MVEMTVTFPEKIKEYVERQMTLQGCSTTSDYLLELIKEDRLKKAKERLEALVIEGIESGDPIPVTPEFWKELWARVDARQEARRKQESSRE